MQRFWRRDQGGGRGARAALQAAVMTAVVAAGLHACKPISAPLEYSFTVLETSADSLPPADPTKMYVYRFAGPNADSLLRAVLNARIPVNEAWEPVQDMCMGDPVGPRFTVVLETTSTRISSYNFDSGHGITGCTTRVRRWVVVRNFF